MPQDVDQRFGRPNGRGPHPWSLDREVAKVVRSSRKPSTIRGIQRGLIEAGVVRSTTTIRRSIDYLVSDGTLERIDVQRWSTGQDALGRACWPSGASVLRPHRQKAVTPPS